MDIQNLIQLLLSGLGIVLLLIYLVPLIKIVLISFRSLKNFNEQYGKNSWAVITGATDGIGKGFCIQLAKLGFNICLISRSEQKLQDTQKELQAINKGIQTKYIVADFMNSRENVSILVNNVGTSFGGEFLKIEEEKFQQIITLNCFPIVFLTRRLIPQMLSRRNKKTKSAIINIASVSGERPMPFGQVYSGSKAFDDYFSRALSIEYINQLDILSVRPCAVSTPLTRYTNRLGTVTPEQCAHGSLQHLGLSISTNGHIIHSIQSWSMNLLPEFIILWYFGYETKKFYQYCDDVDKKNNKKQQ